MRAACLMALVMSLALLPAAGFAQKQLALKAVVTAGPHGCAAAPVSVDLGVPRSAQRATGTQWSASMTCQGAAVPAQAELDGRKLGITWLAIGLGPGESRTYTCTLTRSSSADPGGRGIQVSEQGGNLDIRAGGRLVTRYDVTTGPNKPFFYPVLAPGGTRLMRGWPIEPIPGETSRDHPHQRGLWFTHGDVNGTDYWSQEANAGRTVNRGFADITSGPVYGRFQAKTDWIDHSGKRVAEDARVVTVYETPDGYLVDFIVTMRPVGGPLTFGDTKEGTFGIRLADSMRVDRGQGHIVTSAGIRDAAAWSTRADWVDYYGPVDGKTVGIAILDDPKNLRHPTYWHVRDYGLFAANPFGIHDFVKGQPAHAGDFTVPAGGSITFRYRVLLHAGTTEEAHVADLWSAFAEPPTVRVSR